MNLEDGEDAAFDDMFGYSNGPVFLSVLHGAQNNVVHGSSPCDL